MVTSVTARVSSIDSHSSTVRAVGAEPSSGRWTLFRAPAAAHRRHMATPIRPDSIHQRDHGDDPPATWEMIVRSLRHVIPYADLEDIDRSAPICDEADLDSSEFVQLMEAVAVESGVSVPEPDYPMVTTLAGLEDYLRSHAVDDS